MSGERGLGAAQFGTSNGGTASSGSGTNGNGSSFHQQFTYNHNCCSHQASNYPDIGRVQVTAKILFGSVAAIQTVNAEKCRKK